MGSKYPGDNTDNTVYGAKLLFEYLDKGLDGGALNSSRPLTCLRLRALCGFCATFIVVAMAAVFFSPESAITAP